MEFIEMVIEKIADITIYKFVDPNIYVLIWEKMIEFSELDEVKFVATLCTVLPVIIPLAGKRLYSNDKKLVFSTKKVYIGNNKYFDLNDISIEYKGEKYNDLTITNIAVWNKGKCKIDCDNHVIKIRDNCKNTIVGTKCKYSTGRVRMEEQIDNTINVTFDSLNSKEGFVLQLVQNGKYNDLNIMCSIPDVHFCNRSDHVIRRWIIVPLAFIMPLSAGLLMILAIKRFVEDVLNHHNVFNLFYIVIVVLVVVCILVLVKAANFYKEQIDDKINDVLFFNSKNLILNKDIQEFEAIRLRRNTSQNEFVYKKIYRRYKINLEKYYLVYNNSKEVVEVYTIDDVLVQKLNKLNSGDDKVQLKLKKADASIRKKFLGKSVKYIVPTFLDRIKQIINKI